MTPNAPSNDRTDAPKQLLSLARGTQEQRYINAIHAEMQSLSPEVRQTVLHELRQVFTMEAASAKSNRLSHMRRILALVCARTRELAELLGAPTDLD
ncbi:MAG: hypothetical protein WCV62_04360 [Candidatus Peribacteraceae bacterium]|jgi:hypothetical protein